MSTSNGRVRSSRSSVLLGDQPFDTIGKDTAVAFDKTSDLTGSFPPIGRADSVNDAGEDVRTPSGPLFGLANVC
jgi:hypothetical protein